MVTVKKMMKTMTYRKGKTIWKRAKVNRHEISLCNYFGRGSFNKRRSSTDTRLSYFITEEEDDDAEGDVEGEVEDEEEDA